ncbi:MAG: hypothetical protein ACRDRA_13115 [Pseudonocardiaceae bacterium]
MGGRSHRIIDATGTDITALIGNTAVLRGCDRPSSSTRRWACRPSPTSSPSWTSPPARGKGTPAGGALADALRRAGYDEGH